MIISTLFHGEFAYPILYSLLFLHKPWIVVYIWWIQNYRSFFLSCISDLNDAENKDWYLISFDDKAAKNRSFANDYSKISFKLQNPLCQE